MKKILTEVLYMEMKWVNTSMYLVRKTRRKRICDLGKKVCVQIFVKKILQTFIIKYCKAAVFRTKK